MEENLRMNHPLLAYVENAKFNDLCFDEYYFQYNQYTEKCWLGREEDPIKILGANISTLDKNDEEILVAKMVMKYVDFAPNGYSIWDTLDHDSMCFEFVDMYDHDNQLYHESVLRFVEDEEPEALLILDDLKVHPEYLGNGFGAALLYNFLSSVKLSADILVTKSFPMTPTKKKEHSGAQVTDPFEQYEQEGSEEELLEAQSSLNRYYKKIGFEKIFHDKDLFVFDLKAFNREVL